MSTLAIHDKVLAEFANQVGDEGSVAVVGGRTRWDSGGPLDPDVRTLEAPTGIIAYQPAEMTVHVRAGTPVADFHRELAEHRQHSPLPERGGTVGGAVAVGENGIDVLGRGRVRDAALQIRYVSAEGRLVTGGGPTVKNVSGYNLPKLLVGSLGTLGLFGDVVLRTNPIPPAQVWLEGVDIDPWKVFDCLLDPSAVLWDGTSTWVHLGGHGPDVAEEVAALNRQGSFVEVEGPPSLPSHRRSLTPAQLREPPTDAGPFVAEIGVGILHTTAPGETAGQAPGVVALARRIKNQFDPLGRLNPGRVPGVGA